MLSFKLSLNSTKYWPTGILKNLTLPDLSETALEMTVLVLVAWINLNSIPSRGFSSMPITFPSMLKGEETIV